MPSRPAQVKDPMAMSYYRRLSIAEHINIGDPGISPNQNSDMVQRRQLEGSIPQETPYHGNYSRVHPPTWEQRRRLLPAYASRIAVEMEEEHGLPVKSMKLYRVEHRIVNPLLWTDETIPERGPYHPTQYLPYFLGEYSPEGELLDPRAKMLYWLIPNLQQASGRFGEDSEKVSGYIDNLSKHAGKKIDWERLK